MTNTFALSSEVQTALDGLVADLFNVAIDCDQSPRQWIDISCDGSLRSTLQEIGLDEVYEENVAAQNAIDEYLKEATVDLFYAVMDGKRAAVINAKDLGALQDALVDADAFASDYGLDPQSIYKAEALKTFGGTELQGQAIWSWDEKRVLHGFGEWVISDRDAATGATIHQESGGFEIDDVHYKFEDRFYLGSDQIDTIRFSRWEPQDAVSSVRAGVVDIQPFERDIVLLSELIERVKAAEAEAELFGDEA